MNFYAHHIGDYSKKTAHLSILEDGCYRRLIDVYYTTERALPPDLKAVCRLVRGRTRQECEAVKVVLGEFFTLQVDGWHQKRCDEELDKQHSKSEKARASAALRWHSDGNANAYANASGTHDVGNANPVTSNHEPEEKHPSAKADESKPGVSPCPHLEIIEAYHRLLPTGRRVNAKLWNGSRAKHLQARWREDPERQTLAWWEKFFGYCAESRFLTGNAPPKAGQEPFEISLDWIVTPEKFVSIHEGKYHR